MHSTLCLRWTRYSIYPHVKHSTHYFTLHLFSSLYIVLCAPTPYILLGTTLNTPAYYTILHTYTLHSTLYSTLRTLYSILLYTTHCTAQNSLFVQILQKFVVALYTLNSILYLIRLYTHKILYSVLDASTLYTLLYIRYTLYISLEP